MADGKKSFLASSAFKLILVWIALGVALSVGVYASRPAMLKACEGYLEQYHQAVGGAPEAEAPEGQEGVNPCFEYEEKYLELKTAAQGVEPEAAGDAKIPPEKAAQALAALPTANLAAAMYSWTDKMKLGNAWAIPNFLILITVLVYFTKDMLIANMNTRRETLAKALADAEKARQEAEALKAEYTARLKDMGAELERLRSEMRAQAEDEKARIVKAAQAQAARIKTEADFTAKQEVLVAQFKLREEAARLAVQVAEQVVREVITDKDRDRLMNDFLTGVKEQAK